MGKICCFTGHRPHKIPWLADPHHPICQILRQVLREKILHKIDQGYDYFISGMALGCDLLCAEVVLSLRSDFPDIKLECALPCPQQTKFWTDEQRNIYQEILSESNYINIMSPNYSTACLHIRNNYMVKKSDSLIAIWDGSPGGTKNTITLAQKHHISVDIIDPNECLADALL